MAMIPNPSDEPADFLREVLYAYRFEGMEGGKADVLRSLEGRLKEHRKRGREALFIVDEAQGLTLPTLEEIRLLLNFRFSNGLPLTVLLVGQPELAGQVRAIPQFQQRVAMRYSLRPFDFKETATYILFREKEAGAKTNVFSRQAALIVTIFSVIERAGRRCAPRDHD